MTSKIAAVANMALQIFQHHAQGLASRCSNSPAVGQIDPAPVNSYTHLAQSGASHNEPIANSLNTLLTLVKSLTPKDIGLQDKWLAESSTFDAPVLYVHIMENATFSMGIFVLRPGSRIPLHDHPGMFGIIRVISGSIRCRSFTRLGKLEKDQLTASLGTVPPLSKWQLNRLFPVRPCQDTVITPESEPCLLTPTDGNLHELTAVDGAAVFLDILAPPYDHDLGKRECRYYQESPVPVVPADGDADAQAAPIVYLCESHQPTDYWCSSAEYVGPRVD